MTFLKSSIYFWAATLVEAYYNADVRLMNRHYSCDSQCTFSYPEINSTTINFFPKCAIVCGLLIFNSNTDLSESQLKMTLLNMKTLKGGIRVENSNLTNLSFFGTDPDSYVKENFNMDCRHFGIHIMNNPNLTNIMELTKFEFLKFECPIRIENNIHLSLNSPYGSLCDLGRLSTVVNIRTSGNLNNCECRGDNITTENLEQYSECKIIFGGLRISGITENFKFPNITQIRGPLLIENTDLESLDFLGNLGMLIFKEGTLVMNIKNNPNLKHLGFFNKTNFKNLSFKNLKANLENLHPEFCVTYEEMRVFLDAKIDFVNFHGKYCDVPFSPDFCIFKNMESLEQTCTHIVGDLVIESGDEEYVGKLKSLNHLFGALFIRKTKLKNANFLAKLQYIGYLEDLLPVIRIEDNKKLEEISFPNLKHIITNGDIYGIVHNNMMPYYSLQYDILTYYGDETCDGTKINVLGMKYYKECNTVYEGLLLKDTVPLDIHGLSSVLYFYGKMEIFNTNLENVSFLKNMNMLQSPAQMGSGEILINIHHNPNMTSLGWKSLSDIFVQGDLTMNFENLHPDFCLTIKEMAMFLTNTAKFLFLDAKLCDYNQKDYYQKICHFETMEKLLGSCNYLIGDVKIDSGDENYVDKLQTVEALFGSLTIKNTNLEKLNFTVILRSMVNFNDRIPISITNNTNLRNIIFLQPYVVSKFSKTAFIDANHPDLFNSTEDCMRFQRLVHLNVSYNGGNCRMIDGVASESAGVNFFQWFLFFCVCKFTIGYLL